MDVSMKLINNIKKWVDQHYTVKVGEGIKYTPTKDGGLLIQWEDYPLPEGIQAYVKRYEGKGVKYITVERGLSNSRLTSMISYIEQKYGITLNKEELTQPGNQRYLKEADKYLGEHNDLDSIGLYRELSPTDTHTGVNLYVTPSELDIYEQVLKYITSELDRYKILLRGNTRLLTNMYLQNIQSYIREQPETYKVVHISTGYIIWGNITTGQIVADSPLYREILKGEGAGVVTHRLSLHAPIAVKQPTSYINPETYRSIDNLFKYIQQEKSQLQSVEKYSEKRKRVHISFMHKDFGDKYTYMAHLSILVDTVSMRRLLLGTQGGLVISNSKRGLFRYVSTREEDKQSVNLQSLKIKDLPEIMKYHAYVTDLRRTLS